MLFLCAMSAGTKLGIPRSLNVKRQTKERVTRRNMRIVRYLHIGLCSTLHTSAACVVAMIVLFSGSQGKVAGQAIVPPPNGPR